MSEPKTSAGGEERRETPVERELLVAILATSPALYVNIANRPMVEIPFDSAPEVREAWPLDSDRVQAEIALFAYGPPTRVVLRDKQVTQIVRVLKGLAWRTRRAPLGLEETFDQDPLIEALYSIVADESSKPFKGTISDLQTKLAEAARHLGINRNEQSWPKGPAQLSKRLTDLSNQGVLARFGITFVRIENARPRSVELRHASAVDDAPSAASEQRRDHNVAPENDFKQADGGDGATAAVFHYLTAPPSFRRKENDNEG